MARTARGADNLEWAREVLAQAQTVEQLREIQRNSDKVPGLSDVPGVGKIFTGKNDANQKTELVIFLRPTVVPNASLESDELLSYKQYLPAQQLQNVLEEAN